MKKNTMMRLASALLVVVLLTTCAISGTFAKYTSTTSSQDNARVAVWGINADTVEMDLFDPAYSTDVESNDGDKLIAPGVTKTSNFSILNLDATLAPEVKYEIAIDLTGSECAQSIQDNTNIVWKLDGGEEMTWTELLAAIKALSGEADGTCVYDATEIAEDFADGETHSITWEWKFETPDNAETTDKNELNLQDATDTAMGNAAVDGDIEVKLVVKVTATQVNE